MTGITTHLLDIATGRPLAGVQVELYDVATDPPTLLNKTRTNPDGRTDAPMLPAASARTGQFELRFHVGEYFKSAEALSDVVPVRFAIFDAAQHYHVPMLCAPWFFSTYRGS
jgi:5-hydroxyisourate hydrolase